MQNYKNESWVFRPKDVINTRSLRHLHTGVEPDQERCLLHVVKLEGWSHLTLVDTGHGMARFEVCPARV